MKKLFFMLGTALLICSLPTVQAQQKTKNKSWIHGEQTPSQRITAGTDYTFSTSTGTYQDLSGATVVSAGDIWDDPEYVVPIGFPFQLYDQMTDSVYFAIDLGGSISTVVDPNTYEADYIIVPLYADLVDRGSLGSTPLSPISYKVDGNPGSRIFKLEWKNAGFYNEVDSLGTLNDFINFQVWLYEGSNDVEFRYGPSLVNNPELDYYTDSDSTAYGPLVGLSNYDFNNSYILDGPASNPTLVFVEDYLTGSPPDGIIYRFAKNATGVKESAASLNQVNVYPNPATSVVHFSFKEPLHQTTKLVLTDLTGRTVREVNNTHSRNISITTDELEPGIYLYQVTGNSQVVATGRVVIE